MPYVSAHLICRAGVHIRLSRQLYPEGAPEVPVAYVNALQDPPTLALVIAAGYGDIEVEVLTSFIILEHKLRMKEKIEQGELMLALTGNGIFFSAGY